MTRITTKKPAPPRVPRDLPRPSHKASLFTESVIREMTRLCAQHDAINLAQGFPDFPTPPFIRAAARRAIADGVNQYAITWGARSLREALARKVAPYHDRAIDPEREITITCGATEAMISTFLACIDPGDEVIIFQPYYENYGPDAIVAGAVPRFVTLEPPNWEIPWSRLQRAFGPRTRAIVINTPNNPTGKVFTREELSLIGALCAKWNVLAITDEVYEHILYDDAVHVPLASLPGMRERTVTVSALSKTYSVTGWRLGYAIAPPHLTDAIRKVHDFLTVGAPAPLQEAGARALAAPASYYAKIARDYAARRTILLEAVRDAGFRVPTPRGAYFLLCDFRALSRRGDTAFARHLTANVGVAPVPGSSFYNDPRRGAHLVRFHFAKRLDTLAEAARRLRRLARRG
jgi:aminotransferase